MTVQRNGAYVARPHKWGKAPPGAGSGAVCEVCGIRKAVAADSQCTGRSEPLGTSSADYDPYDD